MKIPIVHGVIERRILLNYRVDPAVLAARLPAPFRPKLAGGYGIAGICLIRLREIRPRFVPKALGLSSENAAHRVAVEWDEGGVTREGVYIRRRDSNSRLNALLGGRLFPGVHHHARFDVNERDDRVDVAVESDDGQVKIAVRTRVSDQWPATSVFGSLAEASAFFEAGALGYSETGTPHRYDGLELCCRNWRVEPLTIEEVRSSVYDDAAAYPPGSIEVDCALLMRGVEHEWHGREDLCCTGAVLQQAGR